MIRTNKSPVEKLSDLFALVRNSSVFHGIQIKHSGKQKNGRPYPVARLSYQIELNLDSPSYFTLFFSAPGSSG
jgi:hypothetical protein